MAVHLILPAGPADFEQRLEYLSGRPRYGGLELKTMRIREPWALRALRTVKGWSPNLPVTWHVHDDVTKRFGFEDFSMSAYFEQMAPVEALFEAGLDAIVHHCGLMAWIDSYNPRWSFEERYQSRASCRDILAQINRQTERFAMVVERYGKERVLIENTPLTLARDLPDKSLISFLGPQIGIPPTVHEIVDTLECGEVMDTGHFNEYWAFLMRLFDFVRLRKPSIPVMGSTTPMAELLRRAGYYNMRGFTPCIPPDSVWANRDLRWNIEGRRYRLYHIDGCRASLVDGLFDCERPVLTEDDARAIHLDAIIAMAQANPDCLGLAVENIGLETASNLTPRPTDWEGKRLTFEFIENRLPC